MLYEVITKFLHQDTLTQGNPLCHDPQYQIRFDLLVAEVKEALLDVGENALV